MRAYESAIAARKDKIAERERIIAGRDEVEGQLVELKKQRQDEFQMESREWTSRDGSFLVSGNLIDTNISFSIRATASIRRQDDGSEIILKTVQLSDEDCAYLREISPALRQRHDNFESAVAQLSYRKRKLENEIASCIVPRPPAPPKLSAIIAAVTSERAARLASATAREERRRAATTNRRERQIHYPMLLDPQSEANRSDPIFLNGFEDGKQMSGVPEMAGDIEKKLREYNTIIEVKESPEFHNYGYGAGGRWYRFGRTCDKHIWVIGWEYIGSQGKETNITRDYRGILAGLIAGSQ